jgi:hypothetical protein
MKRFTTILLALIFTVTPLFAHTQLFADEPGILATGTPFKEATAGEFDFSHGAQLRFVHKGGVLEIPYESVEAFEHRDEVAVHLGVAPAIVVGLIAKRRRHHFVEITYRDAAGMHQVAIFQVPKATTAVLMPLLVANAPKAQCRPYTDCPAPKVEKQHVESAAPAAAAK